MIHDILNIHKILCSSISSRGTLPYCSCHTILIAGLQMMLQFSYRPTERKDLKANYGGEIS